MNFIRKIYQLAKKHPKLLLLIIGVVLLIGSLFVVSSAPHKQINNTKLPTPTPVSTVDTLELQSFFPSSGTLEAGGTQAAISLFFSEPIDINSINVQAIPTLNFKAGILADDPNRLILTPQIPWITGQNYSIKILRGLKSKDGTKTLNQDININYNIINVPTPHNFE